MSTALRDLSAQEVKNKGYRALKKRDAVKVVIYFAGGHDDGSPESIVLTKTDGTKETIKEHYQPSTYVEGKGFVREPYPEDVREDAELAEILVRPIYDRYGSFAGDFYVTGTCTWDVINRLVTVSDRTEVPSYYNEEIDW